MSKLIKLNQTPEFLNTFNVVIQLGAILAVIILFWNKIFPFEIITKNKKINKKNEKNNIYSIENINKIEEHGAENAGKIQVYKNRFKTKEDKKIKELNNIIKIGNLYINLDIINLWFKIIVAVIPAAIIGIKFEEKLEQLFYNPISISIALILVGILFIIVENYISAKGKIGKTCKIKSFKEITYKTAILIGLFQMIAAVFPGVSRSGATIIGALLIGVDRETATEFTFFLAIPVMLGASMLKLLKIGFAFTSFQAFILILATIVAFITSMLVIKKLIEYIKNNNFKIFGYYRIILGIIVILLNVFKLI